MWTFCFLQYVIFQLITETSRVKNVTLRCVSTPLCDQDAPPTMLFSLHAIYPFILHANIRFLCPPPLRSHDHTISPSSFSSSTFKHFFSPNALPAFLSFFLQPYNFTHALSTPPSFALVSFFHSFILSYPPMSLPSILPPNPPFLCQSAVTGFVGVGLAMSMSSHSQQW